MKGATPTIWAIARCPEVSSSLACGSVDAVRLRARSTGRPTASPMRLEASTMAHAGTMVGGSAQTKQSGSPWAAIALAVAVVVATIAGVWLASSAGLVGGTAKPAADRSYDQIEAQRGAITLSGGSSLAYDQSAQWHPRQGPCSAVRRRRGHADGRRHPGPVTRSSSSSTGRMQPRSPAQRSRLCPARRRARSIPARLPMIRS